MTVLTDSDRERITSLAEAGLKAFVIGRQIGRHPATVHWFMYTHGLTAPQKAPTAPKSYIRKGRVIRRFTAEEDAFIEAARTKGIGLRAIASMVNERFNSERTHHTIRCRLIMLSAREDE